MSDEQFDINISLASGNVRTLRYSSIEARDKVFTELKKAMLLGSLFYLGGILLNCKLVEDVYLPDKEEIYDDGIDLPF